MPFNHFIPDEIKSNYNACRAYEDCVDKTIDTYNKVRDYILSQTLLNIYGNVTPCEKLQYYYLTIATFIEKNGDDKMKESFHNDFKAAEAKANDVAKSILPRCVEVD